MKKCGKCKVEKDICFFGKDSKRKDGLKPYCKDCRSQENKIYRIKHSSKISEYHKKNYLEKRDEILQRNNLWLSKNKEKKKEIDKRYREEKNELITNNRIKFFEKTPNISSIYQKKYYINNKEKIKIKNKDPWNKFKHNVRGRISKYLKTKNIRKDNTTFNIIGCTPEFLKEHLEKQFNNGMSWDNYGKWHIDHKIPLSSAKTEEKIFELCHYTNLQPLWAEDNLKKSNKILLCHYQKI
jgi:hypothetical protein